MVSPLSVSFAVQSATYNGKGRIRHAQHNKC
jgi:hypothetical protein